MGLKTIFGLILHEMERSNEECQLFGSKADH
uniref:Uncharacterized protein n=1 Tax=Rhizophora mucronata TaxID=61149 RepID=A0A2P2IL43_RHIMU